MKYKVETPQTLIEAVALLAPDSSKTSFRSWIKEGRVSVNGKVVSDPKQVVEPGQLVTLGAKSRFAAGEIKIVYEDRYLVVVDKPTGLLTVGTTFEKDETVHAYLKHHYRPGKVYVVHRLDQDTSGLLLFARTEKAQEGLKELLEKHEIERIYYALVEGKPALKAGTWESYQIEDRNYLVHNSRDPKEGKLAITHYKVKELYKKTSLLEITLDTGRKNQIRAHCQMAGIPVAGDKKYGARSNPHKRLCLHAHRLSFVHPITEKQMTFYSPVPFVDAQ